MKLIKQRKFGECGVACLAMILDKTYEEILEYFNHKDFTNSGIGPDEMISCLEHFGKSGAKEYLHYQLGPAILTVPSLNHVGFLHFIVYDGENYLDPSTEKLQYDRDAPILNGVKRVFASTAIHWD